MPGGALPCDKITKKDGLKKSKGGKPGLVKDCPDDQMLKNRKFFRSSARVGQCVPFTYEMVLGGMAASTHRFDQEGQSEETLGKNLVLTKVPDPDPKCYLNSPTLRHVT